MSTTPHLALPLLAAAQGQKHVTVNEALAALDGIVQLSALDRDLTAPPGGPSEGDRYIPAAGATGAWAGWDGDVALFTGGAWLRVTPQPGWLCWLEDEGAMLVRQGGAWVPFPLLGASRDLVLGAAGSALAVHVAEEEMTGLSGATVDSTALIPDRAILLSVSTRTTVAITGATSYDCGLAGETAKFGGTLGVGAGATNVGVISPTPYYAATAVRLTANGGNFTGGAVRIAAHYMLPSAPTG